MTHELEDKTYVFSGLVDLKNKDGEPVTLAGFTLVSQVACHADTSMPSVFYTEKRTREKEAAGDSRFTGFGRAVADFDARKPSSI